MKTLTIQDTKWNRTDSQLLQKTIGTIVLQQNYNDLTLRSFLVPDPAQKDR